MAQKKLFLLDAMALIYRAHFAFIKNPRVTSKGVNTSAIFGFTNSLLEILSKEHPTHLGVAFDTFAPTFRHKEYEAYKANREEMPEDISIAIPTAKKLLKALNIPILEKDGYEADDIIGTIAKRAEKSGFQVYMVTPDKDFAQLVTKEVFLYKPSRQGNGVEIYTPEKVKEKMGVLPALVPDFLGLKGDSVDNIPGIPKVGDKTAVQLIDEFGTVEEIVANADKIQKKSIRESVQEHQKQGLLSKKLATIITDAPVQWEESLLKIGDPNMDAVLKIFQELEFKTTAKRILESKIFEQTEGVQRDLFGNVTAIPTPQKQTSEIQVPQETTTIENRKHTYQAIESKAELEAQIRRIEVAGFFCFDTETTSLNARQAEIIAISFSINPQEAYVVYFPEGEKPTLLEKLKPLLESEKVMKIGQNLKYDMLVLRNYGIKVKGPLYDTMLAHYLIQSDQSHSMDAMALQYLNYESIPISSLIGKKGKNQLSMRQVPLEKLVPYACEDADITLSIKEKIDPHLDEINARKVFEEVEIPLVPVLTEMEYEGIKIDEQALQEYSKELEIEMNRIEEDIFRLAGVTFNINSPKQLGEVIFDKLNLAKGKKTKSGQYSTKEEVLVNLAKDHELPAYVLRYRQLGKLKSTYVDALPSLLNPETGRIHTTFSQAVASTGRLSSNHPNLQNIPIRTEEGRKIREAFIPKEGFKLLSADYSQVELRMMAALSEDEGMMTAFRKGHDIHASTAAKVFDVSMEEVSADMRAKAKMVNFGIIYGISAFGLAQRLNIKRAEAKEIIDAYFEKYPRIRQYMDERIDFTRKHGYAETIMGRRRYLPDINSQNHTIKGFAERNAINTPVQGSAADLIKIAMKNIYSRMEKEHLRSKMLLQVHDELVFEVYEPEIEALSTLVKAEMENAMSLSVPMEVEIGIGNNWLEAH